MAVSANRLELLQIVDAVAREKSIDRAIVLASMEDAMQKAARSRYGQETEVRAEINPKTGEIRFSRLLLVVDEVENEATQMTLTEAQKKNPSAQIGDWIAESLPPFDYGRIPAQASKQVLVQKIRDLCSGPLRVRNRRPGDRFRPIGVGRTSGCDSGRSTMPRRCGSTVVRRVATPAATPPLSLT